MKGAGFWIFCLIILPSLCDGQFLGFPMQPELPPIDGEKLNNILQKRKKNATLDSRNTTKSLPGRQQPNNPVILGSPQGFNEWGEIYQLPDGMCYLKPYDITPDENRMPGARRSNLAQEKVVAPIPNPLFPVPDNR